MGGDFAANMSNKTVKAMNKAPAKIQITAEQIVRRSTQYQAQGEKVIDGVVKSEEELAEILKMKRDAFEANIHRRPVLSTFKQYAKWEASIHMYEKARQIYERALLMGHDASVYNQYAEMEARCGEVGRARNIFDRATVSLPALPQVWNAAIQFEMRLHQYGRVRSLFKRWMDLAPQPLAWRTYINFEKNLDRTSPRIRSIYNLMLTVHTTLATYLAFAEYERSVGNYEGAQQVFRRAHAELPAGDKNAGFYVKYANFLGRESPEEARQVYKHALDNVPKKDAPRVYKAFTAFEKKHGDADGLRTAEVARSKLRCEEQVSAQPADYESWFQYVRLLESCAGPTLAAASGGSEQVANELREVYERAVSNVPPTLEKDHWRRYIFLWLRYAFWEEMRATDEQGAVVDPKGITRADAIYKAAIQVVPHQEFTFGKLWKAFADFQIRQGDIGAARKIYGHALGVAPQRNVFEAYLHMEMQLGEIERVRAIFTKYLEWAPHDPEPWVRYARLEASLHEVVRARALFEVAISQDDLESPERVWRGYIDFEMEHGTAEAVSSLYSRLLALTSHVKVWLSWCKFLRSVGHVSVLRETLERGIGACKSRSDVNTAREDRATLLQWWLVYEESLASGDSKVTDGTPVEAADLAKVKAMQPEARTTRRLTHSEDGEEMGWEEAVEFVFPEEKAKPLTGLAARARAYKAKKLAAELAKKEAAAAAAAAGEDGEDGSEPQGKRIDGLLEDSEAAGGAPPALAAEDQPVPPTAAPVDEDTDEDEIEL